MTTLWNIKIESERLFLLPISKEYVEDIFCEFNEEITTYMIPKPPESIQKLEEWIEDSLRLMKEGDNLQLVILDKHTEEFLGIAGLSETDTKTPELGIWIKKSRHGNRYGREAMQTFKDWIDKNLKYDHIIYSVAVPNISSIKIAESLGGKIAREYERTNQSGKKWSFAEYRIYYNDKNK
jgi:ribosomal-protein-alanine N-acetyltransferase